MHLQQRTSSCLDDIVCANSIPVTNVSDLKPTLKFLHMCTVLPPKQRVWCVCACVKMWMCMCMCMCMRMRMCIVGAVGGVRVCSIWGVCVCGALHVSVLCAVCCVLCDAQMLVCPSAYLRVHVVRVLRWLFVTLQHACCCVVWRAAGCE